MLGDLSRYRPVNWTLYNLHIRLVWIICQNFKLDSASTEELRMIRYHRVTPFLVLSLLFYWFFGCTPKESEQVGQTTALVQNQPQQKPSITVVEAGKAPENSPESVTKSVQKTALAADQFWIATLKSSSNRVDFKSKSESIWQAVTVDMNFFKYDSLQTHQQSTALVRYQSRSEIEVKEKSLLVFDEDPGSKKRKIDRVILKTGDLLGKTSTELWILTDAGLVQISAGKLKLAKAQVQIKNEKFKVKVDQGTALITVKTQNNEIQKISVSQNNSIDLNIKDQIQSLVSNGETTTNFENIISLAAKIEQPTEQTVTLENVNETEITKNSAYQLNGRLSAVGAKLLINGELVPTNPDLSFSKFINLTKGSNLIVLQLIRSDSTTQFIRKKVVLED